MRSLLRFGPLLIGLGCTPDKGGVADTGGEGAKSIDVIGILITPDEIIVPVGQKVQLDATGLSADRNSVDLTDAVEWSSGAPSVAGVSNSLEEEGMLSGISGGVTTIIAVFEGVQSAPARVTVTDAELSSLTISPPSVIVAVGESIQLSAQARFSDGASADASSQVRWITGDPGVATMDGNGNLTGVGSGNTSVHVEWAGVESEPIDVEVVGGGGSSGTVDLTISDVYATVDDEGILSAWVDVENLGTGTAAAFWVDLWVDPDETPAFDDWPDAFNECEYVGAGEISTVLIQGTASAGTTHDLFVVVDSTDDIEESSESNNTKWAETSSGSSGSGLPNLVIDYAGGYSDADEGVIYYWVDVTNEATADAGGFYVDIFHDSYSEPVIDSTGDVYQRVNDLAAGQTEYLELILDEECEYYCESWVLVDSFAQVEESNESDNTQVIDIGLDI
jgi:hypothetical protein